MSETGPHPPPSPVPRMGPQPPLHTLRSITGREVCPMSPTTSASPSSSTVPVSPSPPSPLPPPSDAPSSDDPPSKSPPSPAASSDDVPSPPLGTSTASESDHDGEPDPHAKPRISSVTDISHASPDNTRTEIEPLQSRNHLPDVQCAPIYTPNEDDDECGSTYSHASAINLDDLDDDDLASLRLHAAVSDAAAPPCTNSCSPNSTTATIRPVISRQILEIRRQSFVNSFARAQLAKSRRSLKSQQAENPEPQPEPLLLMERSVRALVEVLDMNLIFAKAATERFVAFSSLFTSEERNVIADVLREASNRLRNETPTPWRSPIWAAAAVVMAARRPLLRAPPPPPVAPNQSENSLKSYRPTWGRQPRPVTSEALLHAVVFGTGVTKNSQSFDESAMRRFGGDGLRDEVSRRALRCERFEVPLSFAMTLAAVLATFARLDCTTTFSRYGSRSAARRRTSCPTAVIWLKTKYDGIRLSFGLTLQGDNPCVLVFRRPRIFSTRKIDDYATLVLEAKDVLTEFGRDLTQRPD